MSRRRLTNVLPRLADHWRFILPVLSVAILLSSPSASKAQGVIFGTVQNSDLSNPASLDLSWFGFLDGTDEEIRIESNTGAGYDGINWFDNFQNYTTEASGNPYDFIYVNPLRSESFRLTGVIPLNSFQEEDVVLQSAVIPATPSNVTATVISSSQIDLSWSPVGGLTYHVYRRDNSNNGVYFRIDDPTGNPANPGVAGGNFSDLTSDGVSTYVYLLIGEDAAGNFSAHSMPHMVDASGPPCLCPNQADINGDDLRNPLDLNALIDIIFFAAPNVTDDGCPVARADFNCNGLSDPLDLNLMIDHLFFAGSGPCSPCAP